MTSGADLFVICKQCGSEVSPYITECPYCGNRLRRRAPKLPRANAPRSAAKARTRLSGVLGGSRRAPGAASGASRLRAVPRVYEHSRPLATIAIVLGSAGVWVLEHARPSLYSELVVFGPLHSHWWRVLTFQFAYANRVYAFVALMAIAVFGWLVERRLGPAVVLALFFGAGASGALATEAAYPIAYLGGGNAAALALLAAWAAPDLRAARAGAYYEGDLLAAAAAAALLLALPFAVYYEASWIGGLLGVAIGLLAGLGVRRSEDQR